MLCWGERGEQRTWDGAGGSSSFFQGEWGPLLEGRGEFSSLWHKRSRAGLWLPPAHAEPRNEAIHSELLASAFIDGKVWVTPRGQHWLRAPRQPLPVEPWGSLHLVSLLLLLLRAGAGTALPYCSRAIPALGAVPGRADALGAVQPRKAIPVGMCHASPMGQSSGLAALGLALNPRIGGSHPLVAVVREGGHELWLAG